MSISIAVSAAIAHGHPAEEGPKCSKPLNDADEKEIHLCIETLKLTPWFMFCSEKTLKAVAKKMKKETFHTGDIIIQQGVPHEKMWVVSSGSVARWRHINDKNHLMEVDERGGTNGFYYIMQRAPCYATAKCM